jgi:WD40 repeat protein
MNTHAFERFRSFKKSCVLAALLSLVAPWVDAIHAAQPAGVTDDQISVMAFAPDGKALATGRNGGEIQFHSAPDSTFLFGFDKARKGILSLAFSRDGSFLAAGDRGGEISLWDVRKKTLLKRWQAHKREVGALAWRARDEGLISGGYDGFIRFWQQTDFKETKAFQSKGRVTSLALTADGQKLFSAGVVDEQLEAGTNRFGTSDCDWVRIWDVATGQVEKTALRGTHVAVTPGGGVVAAAGPTVAIRVRKRSTSYDGMDRLTILDVAKNKALLDTPYRGNLLALSVDGKLVATGGYYAQGFQGGFMGPNRLTWERMDIRLRIWDFASAKELLRLPQDDAHAIALSRDGKFLAAAGSRIALRIWDIDKEKRQPTPDPKEIISVPADPWLVRLVKDFERLLDKQPGREELRRAHLLLHQGNVTDALALLRRLRAPASVPLLLRYLFDANKQVWETQAIRDALVVLTGETMPSRHGARRDAEDWYQALLKKGGPATDLRRFSHDQLKTIITLLAGTTLSFDDREIPSTPTRLRYKIEALLDGQDDGQETWWPNELHPDMLPLMLATMGHGEPAAGAKSQPILWEYLPLLAELGRQGQAGELERLARDDKQNAAVRIVCLWAHAAATGTLAAAPALELARREKRLDRRIAVLLALERGATDDIRAQLRQSLKDPNRSIREAATLALTPCKDAAGVALIRPRLLAGAQLTHDETEAMLEYLAAVRSREAQTTLAEFLRSARADPCRWQELWLAVVSFGRATGQQFQDPNAYYTNLDVRRAADRALAWWAAKNPS